LIVNVVYFGEVVFLFSELKNITFMAHLLSSFFFLYKKIISPIFFGSRNIKLTRIEKNKKKEMFF